MDFSAFETTDDKSLLTLKYLTKMKDEWNTRNWPEDLIKSYDPDEMIIVTVLRRGKLTTMYLRWRTRTTVQDDFIKCRKVRKRHW